MYFFQNLLIGNNLNVDIEDANILEVIHRCGR